VSLRLARALVWLEWRTTVNRLTKATHRDDLEQVSRWGEAVLRVVVVALMLPTMALAAVAAIAGGWLAARDAAHAAVVAIVAGAAASLPVLWMLFSPVSMLGARGVERGVLLRLLPIPQRLLRNAEVVRALADPVFALFAPALLVLPAGAAAAGRPLLALALLAAALTFLAATALLGNLMLLGAQLVLRGRRRAELVTLVFLVVLSTVGVAPQLVVNGDRRGGRATVARAERAAAPARAAEVVGMLRVLPPGAYAATILDGAARRWGRVALDLGLLAAWAAALYLLAIPVHARLLGVPERGPAGRAGAVRAGPLRLPLVAPETAAVAAAELRGILRTVRGKLALFYPALMTVMLAVVFSRRENQIEGLTVGPLLLGGVALLGAVAGVGTFACNQFAIQGPGLILELLLPLAGRRLAAGKALAIGALVAGGLFLALLPPMVLAPGANPATWPALWLAGLAAYAAASPAAVALSALFAKPVELSRLGNAGQPNAVASLLYLLAVAVAAAPAVALIALAGPLLGSPWAAPPLVAAYGALAVAAARALLPFAERLLAARRENLALVVAGR